MAQRISEEKIAQIIQLYQDIGIYSKVAKMVGCSPSTVKKYCTGAIAAITVNKPKILFDKKIRKVDNIDLSFFLESYPNLTTLTSEELEDMKGLWKEI